MKIKTIVLSLLVLSVLACQNEKYIPGTETEAQRDTRMEWWRDARFGMFIHWGLYAVPAGQWGESTNHAEWIRTSAQIPLETYDKFVDQFNPVKFNADQWASLAKEAGMKYIVITSKHHDGFCLWDSKYTDFDIMSTPFKRDIMKEMADACKKQDIKMCWYHSIMDWHNPNYLPRRGWEKDRSTEGADFDKYVDHMKKQLKELLTKYGDIGVLWFDGEWEKTWTSDYGTDLYNYVRGLQPNIIVNNRVGVGRSGMAGTTKNGEFGGDFGTPEQQIPATGLPGVDWETCMTMNDHWGYNRVDKDFKSTKDLLQKLADIASKGGNFLLNVGPTAEGLFPQESIDRLKSIGSWMKTNGESIYGTKASPFKSLPWGRCTQKAMKESTRLYLHVFNWPESKQLRISGLGSETIRAFLLADPQQDELNITRERDAVIIDVPADCPDPINTVVILDIVGEPIVFDAPIISANASIFTNELNINISKSEDISEIRYTLDGSLPNKSSLLYSGNLTINESSTVKTSCFMNNLPISATASQSFEKVTPLPGRSLRGLKAGLKYNYYEGDWNKIPDYNGITPKKQGVAENFDLAAKEIEENFSIDYQGFIDIPDDGVYTFYLTSDDGSILYIGEKLLINNDGPHGPAELSGEIPLGKGLHAIRISFFEKSGGNMLELAWSGPDFERQLIPANILQHVK
ncbi:MAG: alpha-L-fucosidase [Bacteroidales bacterium]|nr:alpha-L-fucosidase [Bacteroidales bacterium]